MFFGKPRTFFDCLAQPGTEGHARIYQFIKRLYSQIESLRVINSVPSLSAQANQPTTTQVEKKTRVPVSSGLARGRGAAALGSEGGTGGIR